VNIFFNFINLSFKPNQFKSSIIALQYQQFAFILYSWSVLRSSTIVHDFLIITAASQCILEVLTKLITIFFLPFFSCSHMLFISLDTAGWPICRGLVIPYCDYPLIWYSFPCFSANLFAWYFVWIMFAPWFFVASFKL
jgi:hypothetical protein